MLKSKRTLFYLLTISIIFGQLIKFPIGVLNSATILDLTVFIFCLIGLTNYFKKKKISLSNIPLFIKVALIFILISIVSLILTPLKLDFSKYLISFSYTLRILCYLLLSLFLYFELIPRFNKNLVVIISGSALAILGLFQLIFIPNLSFLISQGWDPHYLRTVSTFLDPNFLGAFLVLTLLFILEKSAGVISPITKKILFLVTYLALITTFSRSAAIMLFISFVVLSILKKSFPIFILTIILLMGFGLSFILYTNTVTKPRNISREKSAEFRLSAWDKGIIQFSKFPIIGVGFNSYRYALDQFNLEPKEQLQSRGSSSNDSSLLFVLATTGLLGLFSYIIFLATLFKIGFENSKKGYALIAGLSGLLINSFFINSLFYPFILLWIFLSASDLKND